MLLHSVPDFAMVLSCHLSFQLIVRQRTVLPWYLLKISSEQSFQDAFNLLRDMLRSHGEEATICTADIVFHVINTAVGSFYLLGSMIQLFLLDKRMFDCMLVISLKFPNQRAREAREL